VAKNQLFMGFHSKAGGHYSLRIRLMSQPKGKPSEDAPEKALTERVKETGGTVLDRLLRQYFQLSP
jgi:hypothetical protein